MSNIVNLEKYRMDRSIAPSERKLLVSSLEHFKRVELTERISAVSNAKGKLLFFTREQPSEGNEKKPGWPVRYPDEILFQDLYTLRPDVSLIVYRLVDDSVQHTSYAILDQHSHLGIETAFYKPFSVDTLISVLRKQRYPEKIDIYSVAVQVMIIAGNMQVALEDQKGVS